MRLILIVSLSLLYLLSAHPACARILNVPQDYQTIQAAIDSSADGDTVLVQSGTYYENLVIMEHPVTLASMILLTDDPSYIEETIIDGGWAGSVLDIRENTNGTMIRGFTIRNGLADWGGGVNYYGNAWDSELRLIDLLVTGNEARDIGGGISIYSGSVWVSRVSFMDNHSGGRGGGGFFYSSTHMSDCEFITNRAGTEGGGFYSRGRLNLDRVLIYQNEAGATSGGFHFSAGSAFMNHLTVAQNHAPEDSCGGMSFDFMSGDGIDSSGYMTNSILWGNSGYQIQSLYARIRSDQEATIGYCIIQGGEDSVYFTHDPVNWLDGILDADPLFLDPDNSNYHLSANSPCIDAGDPDVLDLDGTRSDIGAFAHYQRSAYIGGDVQDFLSNDPLRTARVTVRREDIDILSSLSSTRGRWGAVTPLFSDPLPVTITIRRSEYSNWTIDTVLHNGDSLAVESLLKQGILTSDPEALTTRIGVDGALNTSIRLNNVGSDVAMWTATVKRGEVVGDTPGRLIRSIKPETGLDQYYIRGVAFDGERYFVSLGSTIQIFNRAGELLSDFPTPSGGGAGFVDLEWDGQWLWGTNRDTIYAITPDGREMRHFQGMLTHGAGRFTTRLAVNPVRRVIWQHNRAADSTTIVAYDMDGRLTAQISTRGLYISGMSWFEDDPDHAKLHLLCYTVDAWEQPVAYRIVKMNTTSGDTILVGALPDSWDGYRSAFVCNNYDKLLNTVLMTTNGQEILLLNLHANTEWLAIERLAGELEVGASQDFGIRLRSAGVGGNWSFPEGVYEGEVQLSFVGRNYGLTIPVTMQVDQTYSAPSDESATTPATQSVATFPNPFNGSATIRFSTGPVNREATLRVYGVDGRLVQELWAGKRPMYQAQQITWDAEGLPGGIYLIRLDSGHEVTTTKAVLLK